LAVLGPSAFRHLWVAPLGAPFPMRLDAARTDVFGFAFSPDGESIAYTGDVLSEFRYDAVVSDADTSYGSHLVSPMVGVAAGAGQVGWSGGGTRVLFTLDLEGYAVRHLYAVAADGTGLVRLSGPLTQGGQVVDYAVR
jgi:Tol biopolymer transport system component